jgi:hypothetical protein
MASNVQLTPEELAALDFLIASLKAHPEIQASFITDIVNVVTKVAHVVAPVVDAIGAAASTVPQSGTAPGAAGQQLGGSTLDQLVALRRKLG